jgi:hypothetical protein
MFGNLSLGANLGVLAMAAAVVWWASRAAATSRLADSGRCTKVFQSPRDSSSARRRFSSILGPRMKPSSSGAGSQRRR